MKMQFFIMYKNNYKQIQCFYKKQTILFRLTLNFTVTTKNKLTFSFDAIMLLLLLDLLKSFWFLKLVLL